MILVNKDKKIMMGWTPKGGCTVACKMFFEYIGKLDEALEFHEFVHQYRQKVYEPKNPVLTNYYVDNQIFKFKVVRNPYKRVVSSYVHYMGYNEHNNPIIRDIKQVLEVSEPNNITFEEYVKYLKEISLTKGTTEFHQEHQHDLMELKNFKWDYLFKIENIKKEVEHINSKFNIDLKLNNKILSSGHHTIKNKNYNDTAFNKKSNEVIIIQRDGIKTIPDYKYFFNNKIKSDVYNLYQHDVELYNYDIQL